MKTKIILLAAGLALFAGQAAGQNILGIRKEQRDRTEYEYIKQLHSRVQPMDPGIFFIIDCKI